MATIPAVVVIPVQVVMLVEGATLAEVVQVDILVLAITKIQLCRSRHTTVGKVKQTTAQSIQL
jgi:hypothetical protein